MRVDGKAGGKNSEYWSWIKAAKLENEEDLGFGGDSLDEYTPQRVPSRHCALASLDWDSIPLPGRGPHAPEADDEDMRIRALLFAKEIQEN